MHIVQDIFDILLENQRLHAQTCADCFLCKCQIHQHLFNKIDVLVKNNLPIQMILPGFPAKSSNRLKTLSSLPDYGEYVALQNLNNLCKKIDSIYNAGAQIVICSDGRVFNDLVMVTQDDVQAYYAAIKNIIVKHNFTGLSLIEMSDFYPDLSPEKMRRKLSIEYGDPLSVTKKKVMTCEKYRRLFNGIHRFLFEDLREIHKNLSSNKVRSLAKTHTYSVIQRSNAWSTLVEKKFMHSIRLSIHPQSCKSHKLGIKLVTNNDGWATPWHNVLVKKDNIFTLQKNKFAIQNGAKLKFQEGLAYYEI